MKLPDKLFSIFYPDRMVDFASFNRIRPMVNQVEMHPHNQQKEAKVWHDKYGVQLEAWAPFGEGRGGMFDLPELRTIAQKTRKAGNYPDTDKTLKQPPRSEKTERLFLYV